jgi:hypothetical protein
VNVKNVTATLNVIVNVVNVKNAIVTAATVRIVAAKIVIAIIATVLMRTAIAKIITKNTKKSILFI